MKTFFTIAAILASVGLGSLPASAGMISFADYATSNDSGNDGGIENNSVITFDTGDSIRFLSGRGLNLDGTLDQLDYFPYFDGADDGKRAGLGVCRALLGATSLVGAPGDPCLIDLDRGIDNISGTSEGIGLFINEGAGGYDLRGLSFLDGDGNYLDDSTGMLRVVWHVLGAHTISSKDMTFAEAFAMAAAGGFGVIDAIAFGYLDTNFYLQSISDIPIPGAILFFLPGLAGIGFFSAKKGKAKKNFMT